MAAKKPGKRYVVICSWDGPAHVYGPFTGKKTANACAKKLDSDNTQVLELEKA